MKKFDNQKQKHHLYVSVSFLENLYMTPFFYFLEIYLFTEIFPSCQDKSEVSYTLEIK